MYDRKDKLSYQLTDDYVKKHNITKQEFDQISDAATKLQQEMEILVNCEYVWNVAEIFWIESSENNNSIVITLKFLDIMNKFRSPTEYDLNNNNNIQVDSDEYWQLLYKNAIYGKLDVILSEIENFPNDKISAFTKKLIHELCIKCPLYNCIKEAESEEDEHEYEEDLIIPTKEDIISWKRQVKVVMNRITEKHRLMPLLQIFLGNTDVINCYINDNWLDWVCGYLYYNTPWMDHKNELRSLLTRKTSFTKTKQGSIEWMFGCIMSKEYQSILYYVNARFPKWFAPHLCYCLRRLDPQSITQWPRQQEIQQSSDNGDYNEYLEKHSKMTIIEWIFEYYVEDLLFISDDAWLWLKNYLYFFKRRGLSMLSTIFENINIKNDRMAYLMLQICNEFALNDNIYNMICLRMAQKSYLNNMQYGRITYWLCKCIKSDDDKNDLWLISFNKYLSHLIENYLNHPAKFINTLHDVCDNANIDQNDPQNDILKYCKLLSLLSKLRDMYLCRYDLQKLDIQYLQQSQLKNKTKLVSPSIINQTVNGPPPKETPYTSSRGHLIEALSKSINRNNRNLKNISDSFDIAIDSDNDFEIKNNHNHNDVISTPSHVYPNLNKNNNITRTKAVCHRVIKMIHQQVLDHHQEHFHHH